MCFVQVQMSTSDDKSGFEERGYLIPIIKLNYTLAETLNGISIGGIESLLH